MGYETRIHVIQSFSPAVLQSEDYLSGEELAVINLGKCGDSPVGKLIMEKTPRNVKPEKSWALVPMNSDRHAEAVEFFDDMQEIEDLIKEEYPMYNSDFIGKLGNDIEDGRITIDEYGDCLGVIELDEMIAALEASYAIKQYPRFKWALDLLKSIKASYDGSSDRPIKIITYGY